VDVIKQQPDASTIVQARVVERLAQILRERGWGRTELAEALKGIPGFSPSMVDSWFSSERRVQLYHIVTLAQVLGVSTDFLLGLDEEPTGDVEALDAQLRSLKKQLAEKLTKSEEPGTNWSEISREISALQRECSVLEWRRRLASVRHLLSPEVREALARAKQAGIPDDVVAESINNIAEAWRRQQ